MKVNSINSINTISNYSNKLNNPSFKHTAVPYPEYENAYVHKQVGFHDKISILVAKLSDLFHPEVTKQANEIKSQIDSIYDDKSAKKQLVSVLA